VAGSPVGVYLEQGRKRTFAGAVDWPGWCRSARDEAGALDALFACGPRYVAALGDAAGGLALPRDPGGFTVIERLQGNATTDFGAPDASPSLDRAPFEGADLGRWIELIDACWHAFDEAARRHAGVPLRKGPRGGGREVPAIVSHVSEADAGYLSALGWPLARGSSREPGLVRAAFVAGLRAAAAGEPIPVRRKDPWAPRFAIRRSAWHALDHAWEIEDRASG
jgi:hypothetical protein